MIRNILAVIVGLVVGALANGGLIRLGHVVVALPPGADVSTMEGLIAAMPAFGPEQFIFPFLAHAAGALVAAFVATLIAASHKFTIVMIIAVLSLIGGIVAVIMFPAPLWYDVIDLLFAYVPMAWIGGRLGGAMK